MRGNNWGKFFIVILVIAILTYLAGYGAPFLGIKKASEMRYGIDIRGGISTTLYPDLPAGQKPSEKDLDTARQVIENRLDYKGIYDRNITTEPENGRIIVEIPYKAGETDLDPQKAVNELGKTALLTFQEVDDTKLDDNNNPLPTGKIVIQGTDVEDTGVAPSQSGGSFDVTLKLSSEGAQKFSEATGRLKGKRISIFMDDQFIVAPIVNDQITGGEAIITGQRTAKEAGELAATIKSGSLPFRMIAKELNSITPLLGEGALMVAINAGIVAFIAVFLFMLLFYRLPGLIANIALFGLVVLELLVISTFSVSLTLPGIAGIILSVGMSVDANVIIFERIKEELKSGKTLKAAIDLGFKRAFAAILDSNVTTLIAAVVLYFMGTGPIKGFAWTLFFGVLFSFISAVSATKTMLQAVSGMDVARNKWLYGVRGGDGNV